MGTILLSHSWIRDEVTSSHLLKSVKSRINIHWKESCWAHSAWIRPQVEAIDLPTAGQLYSYATFHLCFTIRVFQCLPCAELAVKDWVSFRLKHISFITGTSPFQHLGTSRTAIGAWSSGGRISYSVPGLVIPKLHIHNQCRFGLKKMKLKLMKTALKSGQTLQVAAG